MKYDTKMTLAENVQILSEQPDSKMPFQIEKYGYKQGNPETVKPALEKQSEDITSISNYLKSIDTHDWLMLVEISSGVLSLVSGPFAPIFIGLEIAASSYDAYLYNKEGDPYTAGLVLAMNLIPGGQLFSLLKGVKWLPSKGPRYAQLLIKKSKLGKPMSKLEQEELMQLAKAFTDNSGPIKLALKKAARTNIAKALAKKTPKYLVNLLLKLQKSNIVKLSSLVAKFGATVYTFDKLYLFVFRDTILADESKLDSRTRNELRATVNGLLGYEDAVNEFLMKKSADLLLNLPDGGENLLKSDVTEEMIENDFDRMMREFESNPLPETAVDSSSGTTVPTKIENINYSEKEITRVVNKEINPSTNKPYIIRRGQRGEGVRQVQIMLNNLKYDYLLNDFGKLSSGIDGKFGPLTEDAVRKFQSDNKLKSDGIVGYDTITKLIELSKNG